MFNPGTLAPEDKLILALKKPSFKEMERIIFVTKPGDYISILEANSWTLQEFIEYKDYEDRR